MPALHARPAHRPRSSLRLLPSLLLLPGPRALPGAALLPSRRAARQSVAATAAMAAVLTLSGAQFRVAHTPASTSDRLPVTALGPEGQLLDLAPAPPLGVPSSEASPRGTTGPYGLTSAAAFTSTGIPAAAHRAYAAAAAQFARTDPGCGLDWSLIAGIGRVESNHGQYGGSTIAASGLVTPPILGIRLDGSRPGTARIRDSDHGRFDGDTELDRAVGPMQFLPGTWKIYGGNADPQDMNAAALATGRYLCAGSGSLRTDKGKWAAVYRYNHSDSYVSLVLSIAHTYATGQLTTFPSRPEGTPPSPADGPAATPPGTPPTVPEPPATTRPAVTTGPTVTTGPAVTSPATTPGPSSTPTGPTPTGAPSPTGTPSPGSSGTPSPSPTGTPSPSDSATPSPTGCPSPSATGTAQPTQTQTPGGATTAAEVTSSPTVTAAGTPSATSSAPTPSCPG